MLKLPTTTGSRPACFTSSPTAFNPYLLSLNRVKKFLNDVNVDFEYQDLDLLSRDERDNILSDTRRFNPLCTLPTLLIGDTVIIGFNEEEIRQALGIS